MLELGWGWGCGALWARREPVSDVVGVAVRGRGGGAVARLTAPDPIGGGGLTLLFFFGFGGLVSGRGGGAAGVP